jgi:hypothetical protein
MKAGVQSTLSGGFRALARMRRRREASNGTRLVRKPLHETIRILLDRYGADVSVVAIGPAGENLVRYARTRHGPHRARAGAGDVDGGLDGYILDERGEAQRFINVFVDGRDIRYLEGVDTRLKGEEEIAVFPPVGGG